MKAKKIIILATLPFFCSCKDEYVTNEYITNEYVTNEYVTNVYESEYYSTIISKQEEITEDIRPEYLKAGDTVAICATSNAVSESEMAEGIAVLESWGLAVVPAENLYKKDGRYAGTLTDRVESLQKLIDNPNIKAVIAARGGFGCVHLMDKIDTKPLLSNPKWFVGFSDFTVMHACLNNLGIETIHGAMANNMKNAESVKTLKDALFGNGADISIKTNDNCMPGVATGRVVGGNLSTFYGLGGTLCDLNTKGAILLIEDIGEANYHLDRMLFNLKLSGKLDSVKGIIVGQFSNMTQAGDKSVAEIIHSHVADLKIPVLYGAEIGHGTPNLAIYLGRTATLTVNSETATLKYK